MNENLLADLEARRKKVFVSDLLSGILMLAGGIPLFLIPYAFPYALAVTVIGALLVFFRAMPLQKSYKSYYKDTIVNSMFSEVFGKVSYLPDSGFSEGMIQSTGFMTMGNRYHSEDLISGTYKDIPWTRSDVLIQDHHQSGRNSYTVTYFRGRWVTLKYNKTFRTDLQLVQKGFGYSKKKNSIFTRFDERRHKVEFENEAFNRMFDCYCQTDEEAFYLITPQIMEAIMKYTSVSDGKIMIGFKHNICHLAIENGKNTLEPSINRKVTYQKDILPVKTEINAITDFINLLNLDRDIFQ